MNPSVRNKIMISLSLAYGAAWAVIAILGVENATTPMVVIGVVLGLLWAVTGMFISKGGKESAASGK